MNYPLFLRGTHVPPFYLDPKRGRVTIFDRKWNIYRIDTRDDLLEFPCDYKYIISPDEVPGGYQSTYRHTGGGCWELGPNLPFPENRKWRAAK